MTPIIEQIFHENNEVFGSSKIYAILKDRGYAISESTPGPIGVNMATYAGYNTAGIWGGIVATFGLVLPSLVVIILIAKYFVPQYLAVQLSQKQEIAHP